MWSAAYCDVHVHSHWKWSKAYCCVHVCDDRKGCIQHGVLFRCGHWKWSVAYCCVHVWSLQVVYTAHCGVHVCGHCKWSTQHTAMFVCGHSVSLWHTAVLFMRDHQKLSITYCCSVFTESGLWHTAVFVYVVTASSRQPTAVLFMCDHQHQPTAEAYCCIVYVWSTEVGYGKGLLLWSFWSLEAVCGTVLCFCVVTELACARDWPHVKYEIKKK